jgi:ABC-2 type transport system permease protein
MSDDAIVLDARQPDLTGGGWAYLHTVYLIWRRDLVLYRRNRTLIVLSLVQPLFFLLFLGAGLAAAWRGIDNVPYLAFVLPGVLCMAVLYSSLFTAISIMQDRDLGFLRGVLAAPIRPSAVAVGRTLGGATQGVVPGVLLLLLAPLAGVHLTPLNVVQTVVLLVCLSLAMASLGVALASRMRNGPAFQMAINLVAQPAVLLSGALYPLQNLPVWLGILTRIDPVTYGVAPVRQVLLASSGVSASTLDSFRITFAGVPLGIPATAAVLIGFALVMTAIALLNFRGAE